MQRDVLFQNPQKTIGDFNFGQQTAAVFDDMLERSIPQYRELQRMIGEIAAKFAVTDTHIYDLGCSTGITLETIDHAVSNRVILIGVDYSQPMLDKARERFLELGSTKPVEWMCADLNKKLRIDNASVVLLNLTLQFVRPLYRQTLIRSIYEGLNPNGCLILVEKVLGNDSLFNRLFIEFYYEMKQRNGYSTTEISQKRESLENVLIPYRTDENIELLKGGGFEHVEQFFKWYNFCGFLAVKQP
ncbi:MAG: carboxy-S-adenosyl-L-methionine synthase CmoA [Gammaproteobacteria bacterium]|nr:carboxy-S-adenosyl-L-methionine synthase CmoA [Gammaproteobacteria bacterium]MCP5423970.1 carboxy-S-adenosyl-L-methionine synthase CmoA [Gammaproteobacteria bacterium]MCP5459449.1 carboxy-S-adenosyl-L-methionine synthase CmoA [Gammaproteobacteria bacterium]